MSGHNVTLTAGEGAAVMGTLDACDPLKTEGSNPFAAGTRAHKVWRSMFRKMRASNFTITIQRNGT